MLSLLLRLTILYIVMKQNIIDRIVLLRAFMQKNKINAFIIPSTDPHAGEYIPAHWEYRKWITGFTGSAGTAVIADRQAGLWTDSRYFLQAEEQLNGTSIQLFKDRLPETPSIGEWLCSILQPGDRVGIDGWMNGHMEAMALKEQLLESGIHLVLTDNPFDSHWEEQPILPTNPVFIQELKFAGQECNEKLTAIREAVKQRGNKGILISALDEVAWTLNLRGNDVHCNPVFVSYLLVDSQTATLYINKEKVSEEVGTYLRSQGVECKPYTAIEQDLKTYKGRLQVSGSINEAAYVAACSSAEAEVHIADSPVSLFKAVKNETEMNGFRQAMKRDGVAMVRFLRWLEKAIPKGGQTEYSIDQMLYSLRKEQDFFKGISFDTIAGYKDHGAIVHYEATTDTAYTLHEESLLLLDSGAQYQDGTTDITRTIALGPLNEEERTDYTLVLKGHLQLQNAVFPQGTCGTQLDILARLSMWKEGINFLHGTGHGVGCYLNVHEGPHQIRMNHMPTPLRPGMTVTDEPGIYKAGKHGVRIENTLLVIPAKETEFGPFYKFEALTLCPIDKRPIRVEMLTDEELLWFNQYHEKVYNELSPLLNEEEVEWLKEATKPLKKV